MEYGKEQEDKNVSKHPTSAWAGGLASIRPFMDGDQSSLFTVAEFFNELDIGIQSAVNTRALDYSTDDGAC